MTINLTLFIQVFNFGIAYFFLRAWLFKPAVAVIVAERHEKRLIEQHLQEVSGQAQQAQDRLAAEHIKMLHTLASYYPSEQLPLSYRFDTVQLNPEQVIPRPATIAALRHTMVHDLLKKVISV
jgi:hypothetical protein